MSHLLPTSRPQPVKLMAVVLAVLGFLTGAAGLGDLIPKVVMAWLIILYGAIQVAWGAWTASQVTPLSAPQAANGQPLVPLNTGPPAPGPDARGNGGHSTSLNMITMLLAGLLLLAVASWLATTFHPF